ncbi:MAG: hypothetical protein ACOY3D_03880, partial [Candidatus Omnitrophota bacterium]
ESGSPLRCASGKPLWRFLFFNPRQGEDSGSFNCGSGNDAGYECFGAKRALLHGIKSEACAEWGPKETYITLIPCSRYGRCD